MRHVYLTKREIDAAYRAGGITIQEVRELLRAVVWCYKLG